MLEEDLKKYEQLRRVSADTNKASKPRRLPATADLQSPKREMAKSEEKEKKLQSTRRIVRRSLFGCAGDSDWLQEKEERQQTFQRLAQIYETAMEERSASRGSGQKTSRVTGRVSGERPAVQHYTDAFLREQAGILAASLGEGEPCPVCGSTVHPRKAVLSSQAPDQKTVEKARRSEKSGRGKEKSGNGVLPEETAKLSASRRVMERKLGKSSRLREGLSRIPSEKPREWIARKKQEAETEARQAKGKAEEFQRQEERLKKVREELHLIQSKKEKQQEQKKKQEERLLECERTCLLLKKEQALLAEGMELSQQETSEKYQRMQRRRGELRQELLRRQTEQEEQNRKIYENQGEKKAREENLSGQSEKMG